MTIILCIIAALAVLAWIEYKVRSSAAKRVSCARRILTRSEWLRLAARVSRR